MVLKIEKVECGICGEIVTDELKLLDCYHCTKCNHGFCDDYCWEAHRDFCNNWS